MRPWFATTMLVLGGCAADQPEAVPSVRFTMFDAATYDMQPFSDAWAAARANPAIGLTYTFPLATTGIAPGVDVRLLAGRSTEDPQGPLATADDVIIGGESWLSTSQVRDDGTVEFPPLAIATGPWQSQTDSIPAELLSGLTVIAVRAFEKGGTAYRFLGAAWLVAVAP